MAITPVGTNSFQGMGQLSSLASKTTTSSSPNAIPSTTSTKATSVIGNQEAEKSGAEKIDPKELKQAVDSMNEVVSKFNNSLRFSLDEDTGQTIVKVVDTETNEVIKQLPSKEMLAISKAIDKLVGLLVQQKT